MSLKGVIFSSQRAGTCMYCIYKQTTADVGRRNACSGWRRARLSPPAAAAVPVDHIPRRRCAVLWVSASLMDACMHGHGRPWLVVGLHASVSGHRLRSREVMGLYVEQLLVASYVGTQLAPASVYTV